MKPISTQNRDWQKDQRKRTWSHEVVGIWLAMAAGAFASTSYCTVSTAAREGFSTKRQTQQQQQRHSHEATASNQSLRSAFKGEKVTTSGMLASNDLTALKARKADVKNFNRKLLEISAVLAEFPKETMVSLELPKHFLAPSCMGMRSFPVPVLSLECCLRTQIALTSHSSRPPQHWKIESGLTSWECSLPLIRLL